MAVSSLAQSSRTGMGATPYADATGTGVTFRTWAPNASTVVVKGGFNGWGSTALAKEASGGLWSVDVPGARAGQEYKFVVNGAYKKDPYGTRVVNSAGNSIVYNQAAFDWGSDGDFDAIWRNDLVIYQMHVGIYNAESWLPSTFDQCIEKIPYIKSLGVSAVKLMPVNEFPGDRSWGYNPSDPYAIESSFGGPDGLKRFVKACHENGLAVLIDVVHNHYGPSDLEMWQYDGWSQNGLGGIFFYNEGWKASTMWGDTRPDFGRQEVKDYVHGQIRMFVEDYHVDGFRWDSVYNIRHYSDVWNQAGSDMLAQVNDWLDAHHPDVFRIAEDHAFDTPVNFEAEWDHDFQSDVRWLVAAGSDSDRDMNKLAGQLRDTGLDRVVYVESHDTCGDLNDKHRLPYDIDSGNANSYWAKKRALLGNAIALVSPGIPMIFAGSEMHEWYTFSNNEALRWALTNQNAGIVRAYSDLIHLRRNAYGNTAGLKNADHIDVHHVDNTAKVVGMVRWDAGGQTDDVVLVLNCSANPRTNYSVAFPSPGTWYCLYNSDATTYDASFGGVGPAVGGTVVAGTAASLDLGAYSLQIYAKSPIPQDSAATFDPSNPDGCDTVVAITYAPGDGPLAEATAISAYVGRNDWQNPTHIPMAPSGDVWVLAYTIPSLTYELNLSFTDGAEAWDNNNGLNWSVPVSNCGDLPSEASWEPGLPQGCIPLQITYHPNGGPLMGASNVVLFIGRNDWTTEAQSLPMVKERENEWTVAYTIPDDTWQADFVFNGLIGTNVVWDNNDLADWHVRVQGCLAVDQPYVVLSQPPPATNVAAEVATIALHGAADLLTGHLRWTNRLNGASGAIAYATNWSIPSVPLAEGVNVIRVSGTNSAVNPNDGAWDSPTTAAYTSGWASGSNGGTGFQPWTINGTGASMANAAAEGDPLSLGTKAWALQADGSFVEAIRPFAGALHAGDVLTIVFENGGIDGQPEASVGFALENRFGQRMLEFYFYGGTQNWTLYDSEQRDSGIGWNSDPKTCTFELLTSMDYRLTVNGMVFEGELPQSSEMLVSRIRFWNYNAGGGNDHKLYIGDLSVAGDPLPVFAYSAETAVTRAASTNPTCRVEGLTLVAGVGLVAAVSSLNGLADNVWGADALTNGGWNWTKLTAGEYELVPSNTTVLLTPVVTNGLKLISIGKPGP